MKLSALFTGLVGLLFATKACCVIGYWLASLIGLVGLGLSHWFLESAFRSLAIAGFLVSTYQTVRNVWRAHHRRDTDWCVVQLHTAIVMAIIVIGVPQLLSGSKSVHIYDPMCGPQGATVRQ